MEQDQVDTKTENEQHEIHPDHTIIEKPKKVRKSQVKKESLELGSEQPPTTTGLSEKPKKVRKPPVKKEILESDSELPPTSTDESFQEPTLEEAATEPITMQTETNPDSEEPVQVTPVVEQIDQEEGNTLPSDEVGDSQDIVGATEETSEETEIPPIQQIRDLLTDFEMRVPVWGLTVFTVDGYILAHRLFYEGMPENLEMIVSSMSAGLITISQDFIRLVASDSLFRQVLVDADDESGNVSFSVMLKHIAENVMLTCIFPNNAKLGLVSFEIENLSNDINEIVKLWDVKLHEETVT